MQIGSDRYVQGDIIEVPESTVEASPDLYEVVEPKRKRTRKPKATPTEVEPTLEVTEEVVTEEPVATALLAPLEEEPVAEVKETKKRRRKKN